MFSESDDFARDALPALDQLNLEVNELSKGTVAKRFPQINTDGIKTFFYEPDAGFLRANHSCKVVVDQFIKLGGDYVEKCVKPPECAHGELREIKMMMALPSTRIIIFFAAVPGWGLCFLM